MAMTDDDVNYLEEQQQSESEQCYEEIASQPLQENQQELESESSDNYRQKKQTSANRAAALKGKNGYTRSIERPKSRGRCPLKNMVSIMTGPKKLSA